MDYRADAKRSDYHFEFNISPLWKPWREEFAAKIPRVNDKMNSKIMYKIDDKQKCYRGIRQ
jgi:hypothetical protein